MIKCIEEENAFINALADIKDGDIEDMAKDTKDIEGIIKELETDAMDIDLLFDRNSKLEDRLYYTNKEIAKINSRIEELQTWIGVLDKRVTAIMHKLNIDD